MKKVLLLAFFLPIFHVSQAQEIDEDQLGAWYMYFFNKQFDNSQIGRANAPKLDADYFL